MKKFAALALVVFATTAALSLSKEGKEEVKGGLVDSGTWAIFVRGTRVASEKFRIEQSDTVNTVVTETKTEDGPKAEQRSELRVTPSGQLVSYQWRELSPGKSEAVVEPSSEFVVEHMHPNPPDAARDIPFLVPTSTLILDDNVFTHREILAWRYLATDMGGTCAQQGNVRTCKPAKSSFGVLVPKEGVSDSVSIVYAGRQPVTIQGQSRELDRFDLSSEGGGAWVLWMDANKKIVMMSIADANVEVVRE